MSKFKAADDTIIRLFKSYTKQGMHKHKAIMLIAASLGFLQKDVLDILEKNTSTTTKRHSTHTPQS